MNFDHYYEPYETREPWPETIAQVRARLRRTGYLFELEGEVDRYGRPCVYQSLGTPGLPRNARARRITTRVFHRLTASIRRARQQAGRADMPMHFEPTDPLDLDF